MVTSMNTFRLLRIPFSYFLLPIFLFALSQSANASWSNVGLLFFILHFLIYPASNGYNSYMDKDETSIGGLKNPPKATFQLFIVSFVLDLTALLLCLMISWKLTAYLGAYILASRLYSYRGIRLKQYPILGFSTVVFFQGFFTYYLCQKTFGELNIDLLAAIASSFLIGGVYPLTQIYQHEADLNDGVKTISQLLGYKGTFLFTILMFLGANILLFIYFNMLNQSAHFVILSLFLLPTLLYFFYWMRLVWKNTANANFEHTMRMNLIASTCMNSCFLLLTILNAPL